MFDYNYLFSGHPLSLDTQEQRRRQHRNAEILSKIQALKQKSAMDMLRLETLRQLHVEHQALIQKYKTYSWDVLNSTTGVVGPKSIVSTGVNTDLSGPVKPCLIIRGSDEAEHARVTKLQAMGQGQDFEAKPDFESQPVVAASYRNQKESENKDDLIKRHGFLNFSTSDSDTTSTIGDNTNARSNGAQRRRSTVLNPTALAIQQLFADDHSDTTLSFSNVYRHSTKILAVERSTEQEIPQVASQDEEKVQILKEEIGPGGENCEATSISESVIESLHPKMDLPGFPNDINGRGHTNEGNDGETPDASNLTSEAAISALRTQNHNIRSISSKHNLSDVSDLDEKGNPKDRDNTASVEESSTRSSETDDLSYNDGTVGNEVKSEVLGVPKKADEDFSSNYTSSDKGIGAVAPSATQPLKLKLAYDDSESEPSEAPHLTKSSKKSAANSGLGKERKSTKKEDETDDEDLDDFFN